MDFLSWIVIAALIDEYKASLAAILIGVPLCFVHPLLGIPIGIVIYFLLKNKGEEE